jgi:hypothetical protein
MKDREAPDDHGQTQRRSQRESARNPEERGTGYRRNPAGNTGQLVEAPNTRMRLMRPLAPITLGE